MKELLGLFLVERVDKSWWDTFMLDSLAPRVLIARIYLYIFGKAERSVRNWN